MNIHLAHTLLIARNSEQECCTQTPDTRALLSLTREAQAKLKRVLKCEALVDANHLLIVIRRLIGIRMFL